ncbi:branched-chain amino acid ABC transporter permease [Roseovarius autotrophicus]|uniref:branched-chain amino acid ABC transporter permease n=1 Tax=Roseovarius autotrophicus TaxID=2824121 RepID=UPI001A0664C3|nr:branched-chain amino acid ABC transporter permease [Roseovarius autotrophicus]MBE0452269.1 branched-chain amino acid ABC transporter permease [Roseovarius sp.]
MTRESALNLAVMGALLAVPLWAWAADEPFLITLSTRAVIFAIAGVGLNVALGLGGLVSFGHALFFGLGGYAMGILAWHAQTYTNVTDWPLVLGGTKSMPLIWLVAVITSALAALAFGALSLRTAGVYFIMITLAFAQMFYYFAISWPAYGGEDGLSIYVRNGFPGLNTMDPIQYFAICYVLLLIVVLAVGRLAGSSFGLVLRAARQNEERVRAVGQAPYRLYLLAFTISGAITGLAGALFADLNRFVSPTMFSWQTSGEIMIFVILGGVGRVYGPVAGAALFILLEHVLGGLSEFWHIYLGAMLLGVVLFARGGIYGLLAGREAGHG